jgi:DNA polymerase I-like protein with 3'-5' exonuclease and polymerase domains
VKLSSSAKTIKSRTKRKPISQRTALEMFPSESYEHSFIKQFYFKKISKIESSGVQKTFDITMLEGEHEYIANGTVVHNCNAEIIKLIICKQRRMFRNTNIKCILQVHDELIFEFPNSYDRKKAENMIEKLMTETYPLSIPVEASVLSGNNWSEAKD